MSSPAECAVVIPVYKPDLTASELASLTQVLGVLAAREIVFAAPHHVDLSSYRNVAPSAREIRFDNAFFVSTDSYSRLLLSQEFYRAFLAWRYILIYQLDAWIFRDELGWWCDQDYAYVGAPWYRMRIAGTVLRKRRYITAARLFLPPHRQYLVGNGGFSLRRVRSCVEALARLQDEADGWELPEDMFWSTIARFGARRFRVPSWKIAARFALEENASLIGKRANVRTPFGCHAWERYDRGFWRDIAP